MNEQEEKAIEAVKRARVQLLVGHPFFGVLASQLEPETFESPPFAAGLGVDGKHLYIDPEKVLELSEKELQGSLAHEVLHCSLGHPWRREERDRMKWNVAADYATNPIVLDATGKSGARLLELPDGTLYDEDYEDCSAEEIFEELPSRECPNCGSTGISRTEYKSKPATGGRRKVEAKFKCDSCSREWSETKTVKEGSLEDFPFPFEDSDRNTPKPIDDHSKWDETGEEESSGKESGDFKSSSTSEIEEKWKRYTVRAARQAKSRGSLPVGIKRVVEDLLYPKLDWEKLLNRYVTRHRGGRFDWRRPDRRWIQQGVYYPVRREKELKAAVAIDTSGSISEEELRDFLSEMKGILTSFRSFKVRMFAADADIHTEATAETLQDFEQFQTEVKGCGGTDYRPVIEELREGDTDVLVYLGDMEATFPKRPPSYDVVWVVSEEGDPDKPPFGEVVEMG